MQWLKTSGTLKLKGQLLSRVYNPGASSQTMKGIIVEERFVKSATPRTKAIVD